MVAARNTESTGEDYGTSLYVFEQLHKPAPAPQRGPGRYTVLRVVIDANADTITRHIEAQGGAIVCRIQTSSVVPDPSTSSPHAV